MVKSFVKFINKSNIPILEKGKISNRFKLNKKKCICDVFYTSGICHNLLSIRQLSEKGCKMKIHRLLHVD